MKRLLIFISLSIIFIVVLFLFGGETECRSWVSGTEGHGVCWSKLSEYTYAAAIKLNSPSLCNIVATSSCVGPCAEKCIDEIVFKKQDYQMCNRVVDRDQYSHSKDWCMCNYALKTSTESILSKIKDQNVFLNCQRNIRMDKAMKQDRIDACFEELKGDIFGMSFCLEKYSKTELDCQNNMKFLFEKYGNPPWLERDYFTLDYAIKSCTARLNLAN